MTTEEIRVRFFKKTCARCGHTIWPGETAVREYVNMLLPYHGGGFVPKFTHLGTICPCEQPMLKMQFPGYGYDGGYTFPVELIRLEVPVADVERITKIAVENRIGLAQTLGIPVGTTVLLHHKGTGDAQ